MRSDSTLPIGLHGVFDALGIRFPELGELRLVEIGDLVAEVLDRLPELLGSAAAFFDSSRSLSTTASGVPFGANRPTQS